MSGMIGGMGTKSGIISSAALRGNQPCFLALCDSTTNIDVGVNRYPSGTEIFDNGGNLVMNAAGGTFGTHGMIFTAPETGKYQINGWLQLTAISGVTYIRVNLQTSNRTFNTITSTSDHYWWAGCYVTTDMDVGDMASLHVYQSGGSAVADVMPGEAGFSGFLIGT